MSLIASLLCAVVLAPQNIQLPAQPKGAQPAPVQQPATRVEKFRRDLAGVRGAPAIVERNLNQMAQDFPDVEALVLERLRPALQRELLDLMVVARRFGTPRIADELMFQLLARPLGEATRDVVETMVTLKGADARKALQECLRGRIAGVRRVAAEVYARMATVDDLPFALQLASDNDLDVQLAGVQLLAAVPVEPARARLCELLSRPPAVAGAACQALIALGKDAVPPLQQVLTAPAIDRSVAYAAFALVLIDNGQGTSLPPAASLPALAAQVRGPDLLARALAAVALAEVSYRGHQVPLPDQDLVAALIDVAEPQQFVANLDLVRRPAEARLRQLTGRVSGREVLPWRDWWRDGSSSFLGMRAQIAIDDKTVAGAQVLLRDENRSLRVLGEQLADVPARAGTFDFVLTKEQMQKLLTDLQSAGFMAAAAAQPTVASGLPLVRQMQLQIGGGRSQVAAPAVPTAAFDSLAAIVLQVCDRELWQQLRHPTDEPDRGAFWRAERRWLETNTDPKEQQRHFLRRVTKVWTVLTPPQRGLALARLLQNADRKELLGEEDGLALLGLARGAARFGEQEQLLVELAASAPGDRVWRDAVDLAAQSGSGRGAVEKVFAVLGADRVLQALADGRAPVRRAALDEVVRSRDLRAEARVLELFDDPEPAVRQAAIFAAGQLALPAARVPMIDRIVADDTPAPIRREALRALGKVGGEGVFAVLQRALGAPVAEDREAALRGLGELRDPRAAAQLAEIFAAGPSTQNGELARFYLQRMGHKFAVPALRGLLAAGNPAVRTQVVLLLGGYQDPAMIPELIGLLRSEQETLAASTLLSCTIGLDVAGTDDRISAMDRWYRVHKAEAQWDWLIQALKSLEYKTSLEPAQFAAGAGLQPVPELARILVEGDPGRIRVLAAAVLRTVTGEDYGQVTTGTTREQLEAIAARYRVLYESGRSAQNK